MSVICGPHSGGPLLLEGFDNSVPVNSHEQHPYIKQNLATRCEENGVGCELGVGV